ncbi:MAG TPA: ATP-binding protein [Streptosporangiaceae bacterium]|nr:ATP-binding protein [Streptosporangiaceae bacterium]
MTRRPGLAARLLAAQLLVITAGTVTFAIVALAAGPPLFRTHLGRALGTVPAATDRHLQDAFAAATAIAVGVGTAAALLTALTVSLLITRRLSRPIQSIDAAATRLATGDYTTRMPPTGLGPELDTLAEAFNTMATALQHTETTRRRLLADAAHELRTPLATLEAYLEGLADEVRAPTQETWDIMSDQTARLRRLIDDIALVSHAEEHRLPLRPVPIAPNDIVTSVVNAARPEYDAAGVRLTTRLAGNPPSLMADPERIAQVLAGLLTNALRHTPAGGHVTVATEPADAADTVGGGGGGGGADAAVRIVVTDTGEGIAPQHLPHVFERFYRADTARDRAHGGSGIGLTIARAVVAAHGGTLTAASDGPGTGAKFTMTLPSGTPSRA